MSRLHSAIRQIRELRDKEEMSPVKIDLTPVADEYQTISSQLQHETESLIVPLYEGASATDHELQTEKHGKFARAMLNPLPMQFRSLDASRPWMVYWASNTLAMLGADLTELQPRIAESILACQSPSGGLGGGNGQLAHLAPTYAGITAIALSGDTKAWERIDRSKLYAFLMEMKQPDGSFTMHRNGEVDTRACYCALAVASLLNILTEELIHNTAEFIRSCQTYEGGFSAIPGLEAHGGYAFCALAALCIIGPPATTITTLNTKTLLRWLSSRQSQPEKGFSGRTNKLVDGCYNHWVGGCWALVEAALNTSDTLWDRHGLIDYTLVCCQDPKGGLRDKPGKRPDAYHTNYTLCGVSGAQYLYSYIGNESTSLGEYAFQWQHRSVEPKTQVSALNPVHVLPVGVAEKMHSYFADTAGPV